MANHSARGPLDTTPHELAIPPTRRLQLVGLLLGLLLALYLSWLVFRPYLDALAWATVLAVLFFPVHRRLVRRFGRPNLCAFLSVALVIVTIVLPTVLVGLAVADEMRSVTIGLPTTLAEWLDPQNAMTGRYVTWIEQYVDLGWLRQRHSVSEGLQAWGGDIASRSMTVVGGVLGGLVKAAVTLFTMFFFFRDGSQIRARIYELLPLDAWNAGSVLARTRDVINASVYGTLVLAAIQGALGALAFWVLGLPGPLLWGVVMTLMSIIPMLGAFVVWAPAAIYLVMSGSLGKAVALTVWGAAVIGAADNLLRPVLVGNRTRMHELLVFFGVLGGLEAFGFIGLVVGPVVIAVTLALVDIVRAFLTARTVVPDPAAAPTIDIVS
ncbi:MAG: AI-2E family transporter [Acidobacteria bacterium]|nr:AI-2E family transporter [Acidobacteriota bacterium]